MSRDLQNARVLREKRDQSGILSYLSLRSDAAPRYRKFLADWQTLHPARKPRIAYCTIVYVDESDDRAIETALFRASRAYEGFLPKPEPGSTF